MESLAVCLRGIEHYKIMGVAPEDRLVIPTAEDLAAGNKIVIDALQPLHDWVPEWRQLEDPEERVVGGISMYSHLANVMVDWPSALASAAWDSGILDEMGGLAAWQRTWRAYDFHRHHTLAKAAMADSFDGFLIGSPMMPWLLGRVRAES